MFRYFMKRTIKSLISKITQDNSISPTEFFKLLDNPTLFSLWQSFLDGHARAVQMYNEFNEFKCQLDSEYSFIDFERHIFDIQIGDKTFPLEVKHGMYLLMLRLEEDIYISFENESNATLLHLSEYNNIISCLHESEVDYCNKIVSYIRNSIIHSVWEVELKRCGVIGCKRLVPINSRKLNQYHKYIASKGLSPALLDHADLDIEILKNNKWNRIYNAPFLREDNNIENPLIITEITAITAFILDYLCYATIALPTLDMTRVLSYCDKRGRSVKEVMSSKFGQEAVDYIYRIIDDMNGNLFRTSVYGGWPLR